MMDDAELDVWQRETDLVSADVYDAYYVDGDTRGLKALERIEQAFDRVIREVGEVEVAGVPVVWNVYNMGYIVKTRRSLFSIDLVHRRSVELAPLLDFALITHNHDDHYRPEFYQALNRAGKTVLSNFMDNYGVQDRMRDGGYTRAEKVFTVRDVEIGASLVDHNPYLIDFTTAYEIKVGSWRCYHTGDCCNSLKLKTRWGKPDLWMLFPGCGIDVADAVRRIGARKTVFGHLWELGHGPGGRLTTDMIRKAQGAALASGVKVEVPAWGERIGT